jgi:tripartite-type tricarboxylate transporter receptor subunit TctC
MIKFRQAAQPIAIASMLMMLPMAQSQAQSYPVRTVTVVTPFPPGGSIDASARIAAEFMSKDLGQPFIIDVRPGAGGAVGTHAVARAEPDGYTLLTTVNATITTLVHLQKNLPYDPKTAFAPVGLIGSSHNLLAVNAELPVRSLADLVAYAKANQGKLNYGTAGVGSGQHLVGELLNHAAGIRIVHVVYKGNALILPDLISGRTQIGLGTRGSLRTALDTGKIRLIAAAGRVRDPAFPDMPAIHETYPGVYSTAWYATYAPAGTPRPIVDALNRSLRRALQLPEVREKLLAVGVYPEPTTPEELGRKGNEEIDFLGKAIPLIGLQPQ